jgi:hypothetical protein
MFTKELIERELKNVFGSMPVKVLSKHPPNEDAVYIMIVGKEVDGYGIPTACEGITGIEELEARYPIDILRHKINKMYADMKHLIESRDE